MFAIALGELRTSPHPHIPNPPHPHTPTPHVVMGKPILRSAIAPLSGCNCFSGDDVADAMRETVVGHDVAAVATKADTDGSRAPAKSRFKCKSLPSSDIPKTSARPWSSLRPCRRCCRKCHQSSFGRQHPASSGKARRTHRPHKHPPIKSRRLARGGQLPSLWNLTCLLAFGPKHAKLRYPHLPQD